MEDTSRLTRLYPMVQIKKGIWEIDEFDMASMYLIEGTERAMLIGTGMGAGDLRGAVEMITDKPLVVVHTHGHIDHTGNARQFEEVWIHPADAHMPMPDQENPWDRMRATYLRRGRNFLQIGKVDEDT